MAGIRQKIAAVIPRYLAQQESSQRRSVISHGIEIFFEPHTLLRITGGNFQIIVKKSL